MAGRTTARRADIGDFQRDINNPLFKEAEERVHSWLLAHGHSVEDCRDAHTFYDFKVDNNRTLDVKCDSRCQETGNVTWEIAVWHHSGRWQDGWGRHPGLHTIAYIMPPAGTVAGDPYPWPLVLVDAARMREFVEDYHDTPVCWYNVRQGTDRDGHNYIVSLRALRAFGAIVQEGEA